MYITRHFIFTTQSSCLPLTEWHGGMGAISHSFKFLYHCRFAYHQRVFKTFPGPSKKRFKYPLLISELTMIRKLETMTHNA